MNSFWRSGVQPSWRTRRVRGVSWSSIPRYALIYRILDAKKPERRAKRIADFVDAGAGRDDLWVNGGAPGGGKGSEREAV
ncbi:MAG: YdeI/OmpD-associated family protein [Sphingomonadaceae bacterium]|nr:YdeI/OmpD-associated family protein [Sphingomonadaceae bacterium]